MTTIDKRDKRIKQCDICGGTFEDNTRPNNKKTCSKECADEARKARQRRQYRIDNPKKPTQRDIYYHDYLEYPFWSDHIIGRNQMWKESVPYDSEKIESISAARKLYEYHGGRKRRQETIQYDGDEGADSHKISVRFVEYNREPSEVVTYQMSPEELTEYLSKKRR